MGLVDWLTTMISWSKFWGLSLIGFMLTICRALANGPYLWQGNQFYENSGFFTFCDYIEGVTSNSTTLPGAGGVGLQTALAGYTNWFTTELLPGYCESYGMSKV